MARPAGFEPTTTCLEGAIQTNFTKEYAYFRGKCIGAERCGRMRSKSRGRFLDAFGLELSFAFRSAGRLHRVAPSARL